MTRQTTGRVASSGQGAGCGIRPGVGSEGGDYCLALGLTWTAGAFQVRWAHAGTLEPGSSRDEFASRLKRSAGWRTFWAPVVDREAEQNLAIHAVDLDARDAEGRLLATGSKRAIFVHTQVIRFVPAPKPDDLTIADTRRMPSGRPHTAGVTVRRAAVDRAYAFWRHELGLRSPRIGAAAIGLTNTALALMPELSGANPPHRLVVLETPHATYGCYLHGRRLRHTLFYEPAADQRLHPEMLAHWCNMMREEFALDDGAVMDLRVVQSWPLEYAPPGLDHGAIWNPWESPLLRWSGEETRARMLENYDLAPVAFGLALQGV
ncbi:MAG: hypothetical protein PHR35_09565 [Kiritimatiellae bacterium]|nr:hypothetical protein [Kiritimatiellia bacterium]